MAQEVRQHGRSYLAEIKALEKENQRLNPLVADLELDKVIFKESLDFLNSSLPIAYLKGAVVQARQKLGTSEQRIC